MYWADKIAQDLKERKLPLEWVDDMKTPSGKVHVGALRGVIVHDLIYRALSDAGIKAKYTYVFDDQDPMDALPSSLPEKDFTKYMGFPLNRIPSPKPGFSSFAQYFAQDFIDVFNKLGAEPEILWASKLYANGQMDGVIKECLDKADIIRQIYRRVAGARKDRDWYPFQVICEECGKIGTTKVYAWDGGKVSYKCLSNYVEWAEGCGYEGKIFPFGGTGKLPWKVEWPAKWKAMGGVTVEGAGKDHMSKGGSHDIAVAICKEVLKFPPPYAFAYEWFLTEGKKMSSSKGVGFSAQEVSEILPPEVLRFLMVRTNYRQAINFDPGGTTIPDLFDEYDRCAQDFFENGRESNFGRIFELSQIDPNTPEKPPKLRFRQVTQWIQMANMADRIESDPALQKRAKYAKIWLERFAPEEEKFEVISHDQYAKANIALSDKQKKLLIKVAEELKRKWAPEELQNAIYQWVKDLGLTSDQAFQAIYLTLLGKNHGPKAAWLILSQSKDFIQERLAQAANLVVKKKTKELESTKEHSSVAEGKEIFFIDAEVKKEFPGMKAAVAIIEGVDVHRGSKELEKFKEELLGQLVGITVEQVDEFPSIKAYRNIFRAFGVDWHSRRPSADALLRRIALGKGLYNVNTLVDAYNLAVLDSKIALGAFDLQTLSLPVILRLTKDGEEVTLLGEEKTTRIKEGEMVYSDQARIMTLDLNYRDCDYTKITTETQNVVLFADGTPEISSEEVMSGLGKGIEYIIKFNGGKVAKKFIVE